MLKKFGILFLALAATTLALYAASAWEKPYMSWTPEEQKKVSDASPWGERKNHDTGSGGQSSVWIVWETALPIRQWRVLQNPQGPNRLGIEETTHVLRVAGIPGKYKDLASETEKVPEYITLSVKGKPDIHPTEVRTVTATGPAGFGQVNGGIDGFGQVTRGGRGRFVEDFQRGGGGGGFGGGGFGGGGFGGFGGGGSFELVMSFPKNAVVPEDKEFEVAVKIDKFHLTHKYKVKDMIYNGKFEW